MMKCEEVYLHICDSLDEDLDSPRCRTIKTHLERCPGCRAYLGSLKATIALYRAVPDPKLPAKAHRELFSTISALTAGAARTCRQPRKSHGKNSTRGRI